VIPALVLTAGFATRLRPLSRVRAKSALPVAGEPLVRHILRWLVGAGVTDAVLNLHHLPHTLTAALGDGADLGLSVRYSWEVPILGSAGGPRRALPLIGASRFIIANGDVLTNADLAAAVAHHERSDALVTLVLVPNTQPDRYGGVLVDSDGAVTGFSPRGAGMPSYHFVGVQVVEAETFATLPDGEARESTSDLYPALIAARPGSIRGHVCECLWHDIGTPRDYLTTALALVQDADASPVESRADIDASAVVRDTVLWSDVRIGARATLTRCVVTDGVHVPPGTSWQDETLRRADGELEDGERRVGDLAVGLIP
jgi:mannose-1-phosphate guanylyltransferase